MHEDPDGTSSADYEQIIIIPVFVLPELVKVLSKMRSRRGVNKAKVVVEMVKQWAYVED